MNIEDKYLVVEGLSGSTTRINRKPSSSDIQKKAEVLYDNTIKAISEYGSKFGNELESEVSNKLYETFLKVMKSYHVKNYFDEI